MSQLPKIIWSKIDEAPALATYSLLPIVNAFTQAAGVEVVEKDISLAGRVLAAMGLAEDELSKLGEVVLQEDGNVIKLPNISASVGQLKDCIAELQGQGYDIPNYPEEPANAEEEGFKQNMLYVLVLRLTQYLEKVTQTEELQLQLRNLHKTTHTDLKQLMRTVKHTLRTWVEKVTSLHMRNQ